jgi:hypothetical protein
MKLGRGNPVVVWNAKPSIIAHTAGTLSPPMWMTKSASAAVDVRRASEESYSIMGVRFE